MRVKCYLNVFTREYWRGDENPHLAPDYVTKQLGGHSYSGRLGGVSTEDVEALQQLEYETKYGVYAQRLSCPQCGAGFKETAAHGIVVFTCGSHISIDIDAYTFSRECRLSAQLASAREFIDAVWIGADYPTINDCRQWLKENEEIK